MTPTRTLTLYGGGKMGEALLAGILRGGTAPEDVRVVERDSERANHLAATYGVPIVDAGEGAHSSVLLVATKPQHVEPLLAGIAGAVRPGTLVVCIAAGVAAARIEAVLAEGTPVVRCMPNTPALLAQGISAIAAGTHAGEQHLAAAQSLLSAVGPVVRVAESQLDAVTALSGSGPAYFFYLVEAMVAAGTELGLPAGLAEQLAIQTAVGAAMMLRDSGQTPAALRAAVTSPGGTTAAAIADFDQHGLKGIVQHAMRSAARRSVEIGTGE